MRFGVELIVIKDISREQVGYCITNVAKLTNLLILETVNSADSHAREDSCGVDLRIFPAPT